MFKNWFRSRGAVATLNQSLGSILLISDDISNASFLCELLQGQGCESFFTTNASDTIEMLDHKAMPDVIICDLKQPEVDGKEIIQKIKFRFGKSALPPLIFLYDTKEDEAAARALNASEVLLKSPDITQLVERIHCLMIERQPKTVQ